MGARAWVLSTKVRAWRLRYSDFVRTVCRLGPVPYDHCDAVKDRTCSGLAPLTCPLAHYLSCT